MNLAEEARKTAHSAVRPEVVELWVNKCQDQVMLAAKTGRFSTSLAVWGEDKSPRESELDEVIKRLSEEGLGAYVEKVPTSAHKQIFMSWA